MNSQLARLENVLRAGLDLYSEYDEALAERAGV
jgi:hypothetical protein